MAGLPNILAKLKGFGDPCVDRSLAAALPTADETTLPLLASAALERRTQPALLGLVLNYHRLPDPLQQQVIEIADDLNRALRQALNHGDLAGATNAIHIIEAATATSMAYLLTDALRHGNEQLRDEAADALLRLAERARPAADDVEKLTCDQADHIASAVDGAIARYASHQKIQVLLAWLTLLPRPAAQTRSVLGDDRHAAVEPLRRMLREARHLAVRRALFPMLRLEPLASAAEAGLRKCREDGCFEDALRGGAALGLPEVRHALGQAKASHRLWPTPEQIELMPPEAAAHLPSLALALPLTPIDRVQRIAGLAAGQSPLARLAALRGLIFLARTEAESLSVSEVADAASDGESTTASRKRLTVGEAIAAFCEDADPEIARIALWHQLHHNQDLVANSLAKLVNSPHSTIREIASQHLGPLGFNRLWSAWNRMPRTKRLAAGRALIKMDPNFHKLLADRIVAPNRAPRLRALNMISDLNQGPFFEDALIQLCRDDDVRVASAAVKALGTVDSPAACEQLRQALDHDDARIRANAVEALARSDASQHVDRLIAMAHEDANRPRANAIRALMEMRTVEAMGSLQQMLDDQRPEHRASALWLVEQLGLLELSRVVAELSISDPNTGVRKRASRVINELIHLLGQPAEHLDALEMESLDELVSSGNPAPASPRPAAIGGAQ